MSNQPKNAHTVTPVQKLAQGRNGDRNAIARKHNNNSGLLQPGNQFGTQAQPMYAAEPRPDLAYRQIIFSYDYLNPTVTYYWSPKAQSLDPHRDTPRGAEDNTWSLSAAGKYPLVGTNLQRDLSDFSDPDNFNQYIETLIPPKDFFPNTVIIPSFVFQPANAVHGGVVGTYVMDVKLELLNAYDVTVRTYTYQWTSSCDAGQTSCSNSNTLAPTWQTTDTIDQFYGVKITWTPSGSYTGIIDAALRIFLYSPVAIPALRGLSAFANIAVESFRANWITTHVLPSLTNNLLPLTNVNYKSDICWANPNNHAQKFPWHYIRSGRRLRGRPAFFLNWQSFISTATPGNAFTGVGFDLVFVDASGADIKTVATFNSNNELGFQQIQALDYEYATLDVNDNSGESCGFYLKFTQFGGVDFSFEISLLTPMTVFWNVLDFNE